MFKTIDLRRDEVCQGVALRHVRSLFERDEIVVGEIEDPARDGVADIRIDGFEELHHRDGRLVFARDGFRPGLIAIPVGNRYALKCILGGLTNPIDHQPNGQVIGGATITQLCGGNIAGFVNLALPPDRPLTHIRVLGTVVDDSGRPVSLRDFVPPHEAREGPGPHGVLVGGAGMEVGKTTFCVGLFRALREAGRDVSFVKTTGTSCFISDPLRVQVGDMDVLEQWGGEVAVDPQDLRVGDFVDACGVPSDVSTDFETFRDATCRYLASRTGEACIAELADSLHHRTNLGLLRTPSFRSHFRSLVYVVDPSLDAAQNFLHFIRDVLRWQDVRLAFSGRLATAPEHASLRAEVAERLGIPCLDPADGPALLEWFSDERGNTG